MSASALLGVPPSLPDPDPGFLENILPKVELIESDGEPMESDWHVREMVLLIDCIDQHFQGRDDYYVGGNMFIYFSEKQARDRDFRGPDFFFISDVPRKPIRPYWCVWQEGGRTPDVVIELTSPTTIKEDHGEKKRIYEQTLKVADYFCYNPETELLEGWRLAGKKYKPIRPNQQGRLWSEELNLFLGPWFGMVRPFELTWLRFFDAEGNLIPNQAEATQKNAEEAQKNAEEAQKNAEEAQNRAEQETNRANAAEAKLAEVQAALDALQGKMPATGNGRKHRK